MGPDRRGLAQQQRASGREHRCASALLLGEHTSTGGAAWRLVGGQQESSSSSSKQRSMTKASSSATAEELADQEVEEQEDDEGDLDDDSAAQEGAGAGAGAKKKKASVLAAPAGSGRRLGLSRPCRGGCAFARSRPSGPHWAWVRPQKKKNKKKKKAGAAENGEPGSGTAHTTPLNAPKVDKAEADRRCGGRARRRGRAHRRSDACAPAVCVWGPVLDHLGTRDASIATQVQRGAGRHQVRGALDRAWGQQLAGQQAQKGEASKSPRGERSQREWQECRVWEKLLGHMCVCLCSCWTSSRRRTA